MASVVATLIGDVVASRAAPDRPVLHGLLVDALAEVNRSCDPIVPLRITIGDEYQGCFTTVGQALRATLRLRVALAPVGVRHGVGWGATRVLSEDPRVEDGPGWWAARAAIESVAKAQDRAASRSLRTAYSPGEDAGHAPDPAAVNAALLARDELLGRLDDRSVSVLRGMLGHMSQQQIASSLGITASAVSQRVRRDGLAALVSVDDLLGELR